MASESKTLSNTPSGPANVWSGGRLPLGSSYGKLMMWFFLVSDVFTFSALLVVYGFFRVGSDEWPIPDIVFNEVPFVHGVDLPLVFVGIMTFILITSSVTMVLAVEAGHRMAKKEVEKYMILTIIGGALFLGCQAWEWTHLIHGGTTLFHNPYGDPMFGQLFFTITGFHGFHVFTGLIILVITYLLAKSGKLHNRGHYEMVEKVGLYWHFVDLVWVFVFTLFYLI